VPTQGRNHNTVMNNQRRETFEKLEIFLSGKEGKNIALTLHSVQPEEYIMYFEDSAKLHFVQNSKPDTASRKNDSFAKVSK
jgi:hypothetical protein